MGFRWFGSYYSWFWIALRRSLDAAFIMLVWAVKLTQALVGLEEFVFDPGLKAGIPPNPCGDPGELDAVVDLVVFRQRPCYDSQVKAVTSLVSFVHSCS